MYKDRSKLYRPIRRYAVFFVVTLLSLKICVAFSDSEVQTLTPAFLLNFIKLSEWPQQTIPVEFTLCVTQSETGSELNFLSGKQVHNKTLKIKTLLPGENISPCQVLYLTNVEKPVRRMQWLSDINNKPILSVGDTENFLDEGGMIMLVNDGHHLQFEVNLEQVENAGIKMSSQILQIARNVKGK